MGVFEGGVVGDDSAPLGPQSARGSEGRPFLPVSVCVNDKEKVVRLARHPRPPGQLVAPGVGGPAALRIASALVLTSQRLGDPPPPYVTSLQPIGPRRADWQRASANRVSEGYSGPPFAGRAGRNGLLKGHDLIEKNAMS
ncbi:hypothetical protein chiPu_0020662 [Chiloscyllium punctatum]|uniref:Uncharacterized protein n=1 Tax=Chiloscyllium punctatum TaxID=137246 RepID=A0A401RI38_CHIPU|nr:hypothetical protein [Chiloscyllium punctatum]